MGGVDRTLARCGYASQRNGRRDCQAIVEAKHKWPRWGPEKLLDWLQAKHPDVEWPAVSTAGAILKRVGLVKANRRRREITHPGRPKIGPVSAPNQLYNIDFKRTLSHARRAVVLSADVDRYVQPFAACVPGFSEPDLPGHPNGAGAMFS